MMSKQQKRWLQSILTVKPGSNPDLGWYVRQQWGLSSGARPRCPRCGLHATRKGHDPCLADLPYVINACCGHGEHFAYATLRNGFCFVGKSLKIYLQ